MRKFREVAGRLSAALGAMLMLASVVIGLGASSASAASDCSGGSTGSSGTCFLTTPNGHFDTNMGTVTYSYNAALQQLTLVFTGAPGAIGENWLCIAPVDLSALLNDPANVCTPPKPKGTPAWTSMVFPNGANGTTEVFDVPSGFFWFLHLEAPGTVEAAGPSPTPVPPGALSVTKTIDGGTGSFTITVSCTGMTPVTLTFTTDSTQTVNNIPDGTSCTATETSPGAGWSTTVSINGGAPTTSLTGTTTVTSGNTSNISFVNTFTQGPPPTTGDLSVTKTINGGTAPFDFTITVACTPPTGGPANDTVLTFHGNETQTITGLANGTTCTATETNPGTSWSTTWSVNGGSATSGLTSGSAGVTSGNTSNISFTNTFVPPPAPGSLSVTKDIVGGTAPFSFTVTVTCPGMTIAPLVFTTSGQTQAVSNIPNGTVCTVAETDPGTGWSTTVSVNGGSASSGLNSGNVVIVSNATQNVTYTNTAVTTSSNGGSSGGGSTTSNGGTTSNASSTPVVGATTVHTGEAWAGSRPFELALGGAGAMLFGLGELKRRRTRLAAAKSK